MSRLHGLKAFINQRLTAVVEEVICRLERAITEYEEEMGCRQSTTLHTASGPGGVQQQLVIKEEVLSEQQVWNPSLDQEDQEHPQVKEEKQDIWTILEIRSHHEGLHEFTKVPSTRTPLRREDKEKSQTSNLYQIQQNEEDQEEKPRARCSAKPVKTEPDGEDSQRPDPGTRNLASGFKCRSGSDSKNSHSSEDETEDSDDDWKEIRKPQMDLKTAKSKVPVNDLGGNTDSKSFSCSKCGKRFGQKHHLQTHMRCHTGEKPFSCSICGKTFSQKGNLKKHLTIHTRDKPCICPVCGEKFSQKGNLTQHMRVHTREKPCICPVGGERSSQKGNLTQHMAVRTREKLYM